MPAHDETPTRAAAAEHERSRRTAATAETDPRAAEAEAQDLAELARRRGDELGVVLALQAVGVARRLSGDVTGSLAVLDEAVDLADGAGLTAEADDARCTRAAALFLAGRVDESLADLDGAVDRLDGHLRAGALFQRGTVRARVGRLAEGRLDLDAAIDALLRYGDVRLAAHALANRGLIHWSDGRLDDAATDFSAALAHHEALEIDAAVAVMHQNRALIAATRGDYVAALADLDAAEDTLRRLGHQSEVVQLDRCDVLMALGLADDAYRLAEQAAGGLIDAGAHAQAAEAMLVMAGAALMAGRPDAARTAAERAAAAFDEQGRSGWPDVAGYLIARASGPGADPAALERLAGRLTVTGHATTALRARALAARLHAEAGDMDAAAAALAAVPATRAPLDVLVERCIVGALDALARGDRRAGAASARRGMAVVNENRWVIGSTEARLAVSAHTEDLRRVGADAAVGPAALWRWIESCRALSLWRPPVVQVPPGLDGDLTDLRATIAERRELEAAGRSHDGAVRREEELIRTIRRRALQVRGTGAADELVVPTLGRLRRALGPATTFVQLTELDDHLVAVVVGPRRTTRHDLAPAAAVAAELDGVRFGLHRLASPRGTARGRSGARRLVHDGLAALDEMMLGGLPTGTGGVVLSPPGSLHGVPFAALPSLTGRAVTVTPSASLWLRAHDEPAGDGTVAVIAGPHLRHAVEETRAVGRSHRVAERLTPRRATAERSLSVLDGASIAHLACHGTFRADNPMFSSLELGDGPLMVYDLERLERAPGIVILSACDVGRTDPRPGDEILGMANAFFSLGTRTLIASAGPVPDTPATSRLMAELHHRLATGARPADALRSAKATLGTGDDAVVLAASFTCLGWG